MSDTLEITIARNGDGVIFHFNQPLIHPHENSRVSGHLRSQTGPFRAAIPDRWSLILSPRPGLSLRETVKQLIELLQECGRANFVRIYIWGMQA